MPPTLKKKPPQFFLYFLSYVWYDYHVWLLVCVFIFLYFLKYLCNNLFSCFTIYQDNRNQPGIFLKDSILINLSDTSHLWKRDTLLYSWDAVLLNYIWSILKFINCPCLGIVKNVKLDKILEGFISDYLVNKKICLTLLILWERNLNIPNWINSCLL